MRFREFKRTDEIAPVLGALARGAGTLAGQAVKAVGQAGAKMAGQAVKSVGQAAGQAVGNLAQKAVGTSGTTPQPAPMGQQSQPTAAPNPAAQQTTQPSAQQKQQQQQQAQTNQQNITNIDKISAQLVALKQQLAKQQTL